MLVLLTQTITLEAQPQGPRSEHNLSVEVKGQYGFLLSHHLELDVFQAHFPALEISIQKQTWGTSRWEQEYDYPSLGVACWMSNLGGFEEVGSVVAVYPFINFPLTRWNNQSVNFKLGVGGAYLTNHFDRIENYKNFAIGSSFNLAASLYFDYRWQVSRRVAVAAGFGLTHFSNGSTKTPNYGLNVFTATIGATASLEKPNKAHRTQVLPRYRSFEFDGSKYLELQFATAIATKDMSEELGERFMVYAFYTNILARVSYKSKFGAGVDYTYDASDKFLLRESTGREPDLRDVTKVGINFAYELLINKVSFLFNAGINAAGKERNEGDFYQRLTLKYHFTDDWFANFALSSHLGKAEYVGLGIGRRVFVKYRQKIAHD